LRTHQIKKMPVMIQTGGKMKMYPGNISARNTRSLNGSSYTGLAMNSRIDAEPYRMAMVVRNSFMPVDIVTL